MNHDDDENGNVKEEQKSNRSSNACVERYTMEETTIIIGKKTAEILPYAFIYYCDTNSADTIQTKTLKRRMLLFLNLMIRHDLA